MDPEALYRIIGMLYVQNLAMNAQLQETKSRADTDDTDKPRVGNKPRPVVSKAG